MRCLRPTALLGISAMVCPAQTPDVGGHIAGSVRTHDGKPIAGASVRFEARQAPKTLPFSPMAEALWRQNPVPATRSSKDGSYAVAVLPAHREISGLGLEWYLVVEAAGYQPWREHLPRGLHGYLGSEVTLLPLDAADEVVLEAGDADVRAGILLVRGTRDRVLVRFDAEGRARVHLPRTPWPVQPGLEPSMQLDWHVGEGGPPVQRPLHRLAAPEAPKQATAVVRRGDGAAVQGARALAWNGFDLGFVPLDEGRLPSGLRLFGFVADGCRLSAEPDLEAWPATPATAVQIVDPDGQPIRHARAVLLRAEDWRPAATRTPGASPGGRGLWRAPRRADGEGRIAVADLDRTTRCVLLVAAEGFVAGTILDPHGLAAPAQFSLQRCPSVEVVFVVRDEDGQPLPEARVYLPYAQAPAAILGEELVTDAAGRVRAGGLAPADYAVFVAHPGHGSRLVPLSLRGVTEREVAIVLAAGRASVWNICDRANGAPLPFAMIMCRSDPSRAGPGAHDTARDQQVFFADASGRLVLPHAVDPVFRDRGGRDFTAQPGAGGQPGTLRVERRLPTWIASRPDLPIRMVQCSEPGVTAAGVAGATGCIFFPAAGSTCRIEFDPVGSTTVSGDAIAALEPDPRTGLRHLSPAPATVRVEVAPGAPQPDAWLGLPADDTTCPLDPAEAVICRDRAGAWRLLRPDVERVCFTHPSSAPIVMTLTEAQRSGKAPIVLVAAPGALLSLSGDFTVLSELDLTLQPEDPGLPTLVLSARYFLPLAATSRTQWPGPGTLPALAPGAWNLRAEGILIRGTQRLDFNVRERLDVRNATLRTVTVK